MNDKIGLCISGVNGRLGKIVEKLARGQFDPVLGVDTNIPRPADGLFGRSRLDEALSQSTALLIFHNDPGDVLPQVDCAAQRGIPVVIATTGLQESRLITLRDIFSPKIPILPANNFSLGINLLAYQVGVFARILVPADFQIDIIEEHRSGKKDAPSGTALLLGRAIAHELGWDDDKQGQIFRFGIGPDEPARSPKQIVFHSIRAGTISGVHRVIISGPGEQLELIHRAESPEIFARGALAAVKWLVGKQPGIYTMAQVLGL